jgi:hypothetical protein
MASVQGLSLEFSDNRAVPDTLEAINGELQTIGGDVPRGPIAVRMYTPRAMMDLSTSEGDHHGW